MKKKAFIGLVSLIATLNLVACNGGGSTTGTQPPTTNPGDTDVVPPSTTEVPPASDTSHDDETSSTTTPVIPPEPVVEKRIEVASNPTKAVFTTGEYFTMAGLRVVKYTITDGVEGNKVTVDPSEYTLSLAEGTLLEEANDDLVVTLTMREEGYNQLSFHFTVKAPEQFAVTFENYDGTVLDTMTVTENGLASYDGAAPTRPNDDDYFYSFAGWYVKGDPNQTVVDLNSYVITGDTTFVAKFDASDSSITENGISYSISEGRAVLVSGKEATGDVTIPDTVSGQPVVEISDDAFENNAEITSVTIGANVETIGEFAFSGCKSLATVTFSENSKLYSLGKQAFAGCEVLNTLVLPASTRIIGQDCFKGAKKLINLTLNEGLLEIDEGAFDSTSIQVFSLPDSVEVLGGGLFSNNKMITEVHLGSTRQTVDVEGIFGTTIPASFSSWSVEEDNPYLTAVDGILYSKDLKTLYSVPRNLYVDHLEEGENFTTFTIPDTVEHIGDYAFSNCQGYTSITFGANVKTVGNNSFRYVNKATSITLNNGLEEIGAYGFFGCNQMTSVTLPNSVTTIGDYAFGSCSKLESFTFGAGVSSIGAFVFNSCSKLKSENIHFSESSNLTINDGVVYDKDMTTLFFYIGDASVTSITIPSTVKTINGGVFASNKNITSITIPADSQLESIGDSAFKSMTNLAGEIYLPETLKSVGPTAFYGDNKVTKLTVPAHLENIGKQAFFNMNAAVVDKVTLSSSLQSIGDQAFYKMNSLKEVEIDTPIVLGANLFQACSSLTKATLGESVTSLPESIFLDCSALTDLTIQGQVTSIADEALSGTGITAFDFIGVTEIGEAAFSETALTEVEVPDSVVSLGAKAFSSITTLTSAVLHNQMSAIPDNLFSGDSKLATVTIDSQYTKIGSSAFKGTAITTLALPDTLVEIDSNAFENCASLTTLVLPTSLTTINGSAFANCTSLALASLPDSVTYIGSNAFKGCTALSETFTLGSNLKTLSSTPFTNTNIKNLVLTGAFDTSNTYSFSSMTSLETIDFQGGITGDRINSNLFTGDTNLKTISGLEDQVITYVGTNAFQNCSSLTSLGFDTSKVTTISTNAFNGMSSLTSFTFSTDEALSSLSNSAFQGTGLTSVTLPSNITSVGRQTFASCTSLTTLTIENPNISINRETSTSSYYDSYKTFYNCGNLTDIYIKGTLEQAQALMADYEQYGLTSGIIVHYLNDAGEYADANVFTLA